MSVSVAKMLINYHIRGRSGKNEKKFGTPKKLGDLKKFGDLERFGT
jgi:hypothetical protein